MPTPLAVTLDTTDIALNALRRSVRTHWFPLDQPFTGVEAFYRVEPRTWAERDELPTVTIDRLVLHSNARTFGLPLSAVTGEQLQSWEAQIAGEVDAEERACADEARYDARMER